MEDKCATSHRNLIISWLSKPFEKSQIWGQDEFVSLIEENDIKSYLYHPDMEIVHSSVQAKRNYNITDQEVSVADLYNCSNIENNVILLPAAEMETKERRDAWYKYHVTDADVTKRDDGVTPLAVACYHGKCHIVHLLLHLLQHSPDVQSKDGTTPIMETVAAVSEDTDDRIQCIQHLLNYGASAHIQNKTGHNVLTLAAYRGNVAIMKHLDQCYGCSLDWNHRTEKGHTPLMLAVYGEKTEILHYLITDKKVDPMLKNNEFFNAMDIALLVNAPAQLIGLLAAYMSSEKLMHSYLQQQADIVENIERKARQTFGKSHKLELNFLSCLLSVAYLGCLPDAREAIFNNNLVDYLDQCSIWENVSPHLKTEFWLVFAAHIFHHGDTKAMQKLLETTWAILQFHNESIYVVESEAYRLDRFMGILTFFLLAENGEEWIQLHFNTYPELALRVSDYEYADDCFARGFYQEVMNLVKNFNIQEGLRLYEETMCDDCNISEKSLRERIGVLMPKVNSLIDYARDNQSELELKVKTLDKEERSAKVRQKMTALSCDESLLDPVQVDGKGDSPNKGDTDNADDFKVVTRQQKRRNKKAKDRKLLAELRTKKVIECSMTETTVDSDCAAKPAGELKPELLKGLIQDTTVPNKEPEKSKESDMSANKKSKGKSSKHISPKRESGKSEACVNRETPPKLMDIQVKRKELQNQSGTLMKTEKFNEDLSTLQDKNHKQPSKRPDYIKTTVATRLKRNAEREDHAKKSETLTRQGRQSELQNDLCERNINIKPLMADMKQAANIKDKMMGTTCIKNSDSNTHHNKLKTSHTNGTNQQQVPRVFQSVWDIVEDTVTEVNKKTGSSRGEQKVEKKILQDVNHTDNTHVFPSNCFGVIGKERTTDKLEDNCRQKNLHEPMANPHVCKMSENCVDHGASTNGTSECNTDIKDTCVELHSEEVMGESIDEKTPVNDTCQTSETGNTHTKQMDEMNHQQKKEFHNIQIDLDRMNHSCQPNPLCNCFPYTNPTVEQVVDNKITEKEHVQRQCAKFQNYFDDPAIISMAKPSHQAFLEGKPLPSTKESGNEENQMPTVFPSASHEHLSNILKGYFPAMMSKANNQDIEKQNLSGSNESGYISPPYQEDKGQTVPVFSKNWQRRSKRWRSLLSQLQTKPQNVKRVGTVNILFDDELYISKGSCGTVVRVGIRDDGLEVAVKCLVRSYKGLIQNELKALREMQHQNIVQYKDYVEDSYLVYIALELCEYTLEEYVVELMKSKMLHLHSRHLCLQLMTGLKALHDANILHMDLKPRNVLIDTNGNVRLSDFGLSHKLVGEETSYYHDAEYGTRCWRAPETISAAQTPGARGRYKKTTDVYVAGMILFFIHTGGRHPFDGNEHYSCEKKILQGYAPNALLLPKDGIFSNLLAKMLTNDMATRINTDEAISHPFFWTDQKRLDFLVCLGRDHELLSSMCKRFFPAKEQYLRTITSFIDKRLVDYMGWRKEHLGSVHNILGRVMCDIDDKCHDIPRHLREVIGEPSTYILCCFPNILMGVYNTVIDFAWTNRRGLRKYYYAKHN